MNILHFHKALIGNYTSYIQSFLTIKDTGIQTFVDGQIEGKKLWPEPLIQFNPTFESAKPISELCKEDVLHPEFDRIFAGWRSLYRHQEEAIRLGVSNREFVVTSGTGSGKSLTYMATIFNHVLRTGSKADGKIQAVVVYPMNALINSQFNEIKKFKDKYEEAYGVTFPITFGQYTGQESEEEKERLRLNPPHILLTNYMMLELVMTRSGRDVEVFEVFNEDGSAIGLFYADYFARDSKRGGAWMSSFVTQSELLHQLPVVVNVMNIPKPVEGQLALISFDHVSTMFHEMGHGVHGMFSKVMYPSLSGTAVSRDYVEFPSTFQEDWAIHPEVLANYARHYQTNEAMPKELLDRLIAANSFNQGFDTQEYVAASLLDMEWHMLTPETMPTDVDAFEQDAGRFKPEDGDRVSIAGNFNEWKPNDVFLNKASDSWEYSVRIDVSGLDTLEYKFVIHSGDGRDLPNTGWENITNRRLSWLDLVNHQPVHVFDTPWGPEKQGDVTFTVNLSNQVVLGYFSPENGDRVRLTGSFFDWEDGVDLTEIDTLHTYSVTLPLTYPAGVPLQYRYQILRVDSTLIDPWKGWEKTGERNRSPELVRTDFFNNQSHVLRFIVTIPGSREVKEPMTIELEHGGKTLQTDPLMRVGPGVYETALMLGGEGNVQWRLKQSYGYKFQGMKHITLNKFGGIVYG